MSTFTTTAPLAKILKTIATAAARPSANVQPLEVVHVVRVGDDTLRLTATDRYLLARIDVRGTWAGTSEVDEAVEHPGVTIPTDAAKRIGQLFATAKPSLAHVGQGIESAVTFGDDHVEYTLTGSRAHDGAHRFIPGKLEFPRIDHVLRNVDEPGPGVRVNPSFLKTATTILELCDRPSHAEVYPTGDTRKPLALHGLVGSDGDQGEILVYLMGVRADRPIDPKATAARMTGER